MQVQWVNLARAYYEAYARSLSAVGVEVGKTFDELPDEEVSAIINGIKQAVTLYGAAVLC